MIVLGAVGLGVVAVGVQTIGSRGGRLHAARSGAIRHGGAVKGDLFGLGLARMLALGAVPRSVEHASSGPLRARIKAHPKRSARAPAKPSPPPVQSSSSYSAPVQTTYSAP